MLANDGKHQVKGNGQSRRPRAAGKRYEGVHRGEEGCLSLIVGHQIIGQCDPLPASHRADGVSEHPASTNTPAPNKRRNPSCLNHPFSHNLPRLEDSSDQATLGADKTANQMVEVAILKSLWRKDRDGRWNIHAAKGLTLKPRAGSDSDFFTYESQIYRPPPVVRLATSAAI